MQYLRTLIAFLRESRVELKKVNWPSRKDAVRYTAFVIVFSVVVAAVLGLLDFLYIAAIRNFFL